MSHIVQFVKDIWLAVLRGLDGQDQFLYFIDLLNWRAMHKVIRIYSNFKTKM